MTRHKRRIKLINPPLQIKLTMIFVGMAALALLLQFVLFTATVSRMASSLPNDGQIVWEEMTGLLTQSALTSLLAFLPLIFAVGILTTFRIAGPLYRMKMFLEQIVRGEQPGHCRLRKGDELHDFCELLNRAREALESSAAARASGGGGSGQSDQNEDGEQSHLKGAA